MQHCWTNTGPSKDHHENCELCLRKKLDPLQCVCSINIWYQNSSLIAHITSFEIVGNVIILTMSDMHVCIADILSQYTNALLDTPVQLPSVGHKVMPPYVPLRQCRNYVSTEGVESVGADTAKPLLSIITGTHLRGQWSDHGFISGHLIIVKVCSWWHRNTTAVQQMANSMLCWQSHTSTQQSHTSTLADQWWHLVADYQADPNNFILKQRNPQ